MASLISSVLTTAAYTLTSKRELTQLWCKPIVNCQYCSDKGQFYIHSVIPLSTMQTNGDPSFRWKRVYNVLHCPRVQWIIFQKLVNHFTKILPVVTSWKFRVPKAGPHNLGWPPDCFGFSAQSRMSGYKYKLRACMVKQYIYCCADHI